MILTTERLTLRPLEREDLSALAEIYADVEMMRFLGGVMTREQTAAQIDRLMARYATDGFGMLAVLSGDGTLLGRAGLLVQDVEGTREIEIGYAIGRAHWGRGLAAEAALAIRDHALGPLGLRRLCSLIRAENTRSIRVAEKMGMHHARDVDFRGPARLYLLER